jgi:fatty acid/phospholipid biosynthesis enzyme
MSRTLMARIGYIFAKGAFDFLREKMDVRKANGGVFLGLNGIVVKSHGGTDAEALRRRSTLATTWSETDCLTGLRPISTFFTRGIRRRRDRAR